MKTEMKSNTAPMNLSVVGAVLFHILDRKVGKNEKNAVQKNTKTLCTSKIFRIFAALFLIWKLLNS